jgi:hypothetical protein
MQTEANRVATRNHNTQLLTAMNSIKSLRRVRPGTAPSRCPSLIIALLLGTSSSAVLGAVLGAGLELKSAAFDAGGGVATNASFHLAGRCTGAVVGLASGGSFTVTGRFPGIRLVQTPGTPRLMLNASGSGYLLQWSAAFSGFRLQTTTSLTQPQWLDVPLPVTVSGDQITVRVPATDGIPMSFYRLIRH